MHAQYCTCVRLIFATMLYSFKVFEIFKLMVEARKLQFLLQWHIIFVHADTRNFGGPWSFVPLLFWCFLDFCFVISGSE